MPQREYRPDQRGRVDVGDAGGSQRVEVAAVYGGDLVGVEVGQRADETRAGDDQPGELGSQCQSERVLDDGDIAQSPLGEPRPEGLGVVDPIDGMLGPLPHRRAGDRSDRVSQMFAREHHRPTPPDRAPHPAAGPCPGDQALGARGHVGKEEDAQHRLHHVVAVVRPGGRIGHMRAHLRQCRRVTGEFADQRRREVHRVDVAARPDRAGRGQR
nr:hypothetical protein [Nocardia farcinica]